MSVAHTLTYTHPSLTTKNVSRHCQIFPMVQTVPHWEPPTYNTRSSPPPNHFLFLTEEYSTLFTSICACVLSHLSRVRLFVTLWAVAHQALLSMGFSGKNAGVGCHVYVWVTQLCPTLWDPMSCSPPGSSVHGILQARILEWVAIPFSRRSSQSRDRTQVSCIVGGFFTNWAIREVQLPA